VSRDFINAVGLGLSMLVGGVAAVACFFVPPIPLTPRAEERGVWLVMAWLIFGSVVGCGAHLFLRRLLRAQPKR